MIPILDLTAQYRELKPQIDAAIARVLESGTFIMGPNVEAFEHEIAAYLGVKHAISLNSGTDALHLALRALDVGPGDEVITTPFTFVATTEAIGIVGATPVFVDIDPVTCNIDAAQIESAITPRTKVILPVHLYGCPANMPAIMAIAQRHGLAVVEDCAQAIGAKVSGRPVGTIGTIGCFSFFPSKNLGAYGDAGMVTTNDAALADRLRALRVHGGRRKYHHEELGVNSRLDELQAAILRVKLPHLDAWNEARRRIAARYTEGLSKVADITVPAEPTDCHAVYHQYTVRMTARDEVRERLHKAGVQTMVYYPVPLHLQEVHRNLGQPGAFPYAERAAREVLSLPMFPELTAENQDTVVRELSAAVQVGATA
jgi:dTDP-4-amino-4,6-dideoxygalactose transaminase